MLMVTKSTRKMRNNKTLSTCECCGKLCSNGDLIHKSCAIEYLNKLGYVIVDFDIYRVISRIVD